MFGIGFTELIVLAVIALVFVGPSRLPQMMQQLGKFFVHTRRMATDVRSAMDTVIRDAEKEIRVKEIEDMKNSLKNVSSSISKEALEVLEYKEAQIERETKNVGANEPQPKVNSKEETNDQPHEHSTQYEQKDDNQSTETFTSMPTNDPNTPSK